VSLTVLSYRENGKGLAAAARTTRPMKQCTARNRVEPSSCAYRAAVLAIRAQNRFRWPERNRFRHLPRSLSETLGI
jgi:hypothetical protein